jgi:hypothetical protein
MEDTSGTKRSGATCRLESVLAILVCMGYSPDRKFNARIGDYVLLATGLLVTAALVVWGFL